MGQYRHFHSAAPPKTHRFETSGPMAYVCCFRGQHAGWIGSGHRKAVETVSPAAEATPSSQRWVWAEAGVWESEAGIELAGGS